MSGPGFFLYGSFPNSRIEPTPATQTARTPIVVCAPGVATLVLPADDNRTYANIRNLDSVTDVYYGYVSTIDGTVPNGGQLLKALEQENDLQASSDIFIFNPGVSPINVGIDFGVG